MAKEKKTLPPSEEHFTWKVYQKIEGYPHEPARLLTPHADPMQYEFPFDFIFATEAEADGALDDHEVREEAVEEGWILCKMVLTPVRRASKITGIRNLE